MTGKKGIVDVVADVKGYTESNFGTGEWQEGYDTDGDGMPDDWETLWGLNPEDASDALKYTLDPKGYYTNIEMYANSLVEDIMKGGCEDGEANYEEYWPELNTVEKPAARVKSKAKVAEGEKTVVAMTVSSFSETPMMLATSVSKCFGTPMRLATTVSRFSGTPMKVVTTVSRFSECPMKVVTEIVRNESVPLCGAPPAAS